MTRRGASLVPTSPAFIDDLQSIPEGKEVIVTVRSARNPRQDRWFHAMIGEVVKAGVWDGTAESFRRYLKIALGYTEEVIGPDGTVHHVLQSLSPSSMDGLAFTDFVKRVEHHLAERFGVNVDDFRSAVRSRAGADAEPKEAAAAEPAAAKSAGAAAADPAAPAPIDKELLWQLSTALGRAKTKAGILDAATAFKRGIWPPDSAGLDGFARAIVRLHIVHRLEPSFMPLARFERLLVDLIERGQVPKL